MLELDNKTALTECTKLFENNIIFEKLTINKLDTLLKKCEYIDDIYFLKSGLLGITQIKKHQLNLCGFFYKDDVIVTTSFFEKSKSRFDFTALKKSVVYKIHRQHLNEMINNNERIYWAINRISMNIMDKFLYNFSLISNSNEERFKLMRANEHPEIFDIPHNILCTFFGFSERKLFELKKKTLHS
jgi:CRP-like cAMP-binding protein